LGHLFAIRIIRYERDKNMRMKEKKNKKENRKENRKKAKTDEIRKNRKRERGEEGK
jgi:hypothetical protein